MLTVKIETTQNVALSYKAANVGDRILEGIIDVGLVVAYLIFVGSFVVDLFDHDDAESAQLTRILLSCPAFFYSLIMETLANGQTFGKRIMKTRVIRTDGRPAGFMQYALRWMFRLPDVWMSFGSVGVIAMVANEKGQRLGDLLAGTTVVKLERKVSLENDVFAELPENYQPVYAVEASRLDEEHIRLIRDTLSACNTDHNYDVVVQLSEKLRELFKISPKQDHQSFLETLLLDYMSLQETKAEATYIGLAY